MHWWLDEIAGKLVERQIFLRDLFVLRRAKGDPDGFFVRSGFLEVEIEVEILVLFVARDSRSDRLLSLST